MKKQLIMILALFAVAGVANAQQNSGASGLEGDSNSIPMEFKTQLTAVYNASLDMTKGLLTGEIEVVSKSSTKVREVLRKVDMGLLKGSNAHMVWMKNLKTMNLALDGIATTNDPKVQKKDYNLFSNALFESIKELGISGAPVYYQFCPMALDNQGAYWLSSSKEIKNPYFGGKMLACGSTKEVIN